MREETLTISQPSNATVAVPTGSIPWSSAAGREDMGALWEHLVLNELHGRLQTRDIRYWRAAGTKSTS